VQTVRVITVRTAMKIQCVQKRMVQFEKLTRNLFIILHR
jgi:hypothetical protein